MFHENCCILWDHISQGTTNCQNDVTFINDLYFSNFEFGDTVELGDKELFGHPKIVC